MDDPELQAIRQKRMQELLAAQGMQGAPSGQSGEADQEDAKRAAEDRRQAMLVQILTAGARERLSRIALVKPEKARNVENMILAAAQRGALQEKVTEERLVSMLEQISEKENSSKTKVTIQRRRPLFEDDE